MAEEYLMTESNFPANLAPKIGALSKKVVDVI